MVQWLGLRAFTAEGAGSIPGQGTKIPQAAWPGGGRKDSYVYSLLEPESFIICC